MNYGGFDTKFDGMGASQFAGGGFVPSPHAGGGDSFADKKGGAGGKAMAQTMRNVTIHQIMKENSAHEDNNKVDGVELSTFFLVGRILSRNDSATVLKLKLDDGTGTIEIVYYLEDSGNELISNTSQEWTVNSYVRVCGHLRVMDGRKSMTAFRIKLIKDFNEVTYHNMQCIFQHLHLTKGGASVPPMTAQAYGAPRSASMAAGASGGGDFKSKMHMDVLSIYNEKAQIEAGVGLDEVMTTLSTRGLGYTLADVQKTVEFLANEGQLYSTIDETHFRSTV